MAPVEGLPTWHEAQSPEGLSMPLWHLAQSAPYTPCPLGCFAMPPSCAQGGMIDERLFWPAVYG